MDQPDEMARRFLEVVFPLLHSLSGDLRCAKIEEGPVTMAQFRSMGILHKAPRSLNELAALHEVSPPTMSRLTSTLVERGWVRREQDAQDRRQVVLSLTEQGERVLQALRDRSIDHLADILSNLTPEESVALAMALGGLARVAAARREGTRCDS